MGSAGTGSCQLSFSQGKREGRGEWGELEEKIHPLFKKENRDRDAGLGSLRSSGCTKEDRGKLKRHHMSR